jgi:hypothetical protein
MKATIAQRVFIINRCNCQTLTYSVHSGHDSGEEQLAVTRWRTSSFLLLLLDGLLKTGRGHHGLPDGRDVSEGDGRATVSRGAVTGAGRAAASAHLGCLVMGLVQDEQTVEHEQQHERVLT